MLNTDYKEFGAGLINFNSFSKQNCLSPTDKNEMFNLTHLALRLLLHILQKNTADKVGKLSPLFIPIRLYIKVLLFDDDVPMDTKSVCGILYLTMHMMGNGPDAWMDVSNSIYYNWLTHTLFRNEIPAAPDVACTVHRH